MKNIIYGHENTNIPFLVDNIEDLIGGDTYVLMTCIDSQDNVSDSSMVKKAMANAELEAGSYFGFLSFPFKSIWSLIDDYNLFNGFDVVWFFEKQEKEIQPPPGYPIVNPYELTDSEATLLGKWMKKSGAFLGLGDGCGLNYITTKKEIAERIKKIKFND